MRKLTAPDIFRGARLLKSFGLREEARELAKNAETAEDVWSSGYDFMWTMFDKMTEAEGEDSLYLFLTGPFEMTVEQIKEIPFSDFITMLKQLAEENDLASFFKDAVGLMK